MSLTANIALGVTGKQVAALDLGSAAYPFSLPASAVYATGVGVGQADLVFADTRTLALSATENLDLAGVLTDAFGAIVTFAKVKAFIITADPLNVNDVVVTRPATNGVVLFNAISSGIALKPGYTFAVFGVGSGYPVTPATGDLMTVTNGGAGTAVNYSVVIIGTSS